MGLLSTARTTRLMVTVEASQREMQWRRRVREIINTVIAPVHGIHGISIRLAGGFFWTEVYAPVRDAK